MCWEGTWHLDNCGLIPVPTMVPWFQLWFPEHGAENQPSAPLRVTPKPIS